MEATVKGSKTGLKGGKQKLNKCTKELEALKEKFEMEEAKDLATQEALAAVDRLVLMAKAESAKTAEKMADVAETTVVPEEAVMAEVDPVKADSEPPAKRLRTEMASPAKEVRLEAQVASPARVRLSTS